MTDCIQSFNSLPPVSNKLKIQLKTNVLTALTCVEMHCDARPRGVKRMLDILYHTTRILSAVAVGARNLRPLNDTFPITLLNYFNKKEPT